jgi:hypothetical protein
LAGGEGHPYSCAKKGLRFYQEIPGGKEKKERVSGLPENAGEFPQRADRALGHAVPVSLSPSGDPGNHFGCAPDLYPA